MRVSIGAAVGLLAPSVAWAGNLPVPLGTVNISDASFTSFQSPPGGSGAPAMVVTAFTGNPFAGGKISAITSVADWPEVEQTTVTNASAWPNIVNSVSAGTFQGAGAGWLVGDGFLVPGKSVGHVRFLELDSSFSVQSDNVLTKDKGNALYNGWFYHMAVPMDINGDGLMDVLAARATKPILGKESAELVWLEQPATDPFAASNLPWEEHIIAAGTNSPGVFFEPVDLDGDGVMEIMYSAFFAGEGLGIIYCEDPSPTCWASEQNDDSTTASAYGFTMVDPSIGPSFAFQVVDVNADGAKDVLITNHVNNETLSGIFAYEMPTGDGAWKNADAWTKHTLHQGFKTVEGGPGQASPGRGLAFQTSNAAGSGLLRAGSKPVITIAGDGNEGFWLLTPKSSSPSDWAYDAEEIFNCECTASYQSVNYDKDGYARVYLPCYEHGQIHGFSWNPSL